MRKILGIILMSLLWFNTLHSHEEATTYTLEDFLFEKNSFVGSSVHVTGFLLRDKEVGKHSGIIVDPKDPENKILSVNIKLKPGNNKKLYEYCQSQMKTVGNNRLYNGWAMPCGNAFIIHLDVISARVFGQTIRHIDF